MRISWLEPQIVQRTRDVLRAWQSDWNAFFDPDFQPVPTPPELTAPVAAHWSTIAEHVARAERVAHVIREHGLTHAVKQFGDTDHAIEIATLIAASLHTGTVPMKLVFAVLECAIDTLVMYGPFLQLLDNAADTDRLRSVNVYESFCVRARRIESRESSWPERVNMARDGLAVFYIKCGRLDDSHKIFAERHEEENDDMTVSLTASRAFLSAGEIARAATWLQRGSDRAERLGRVAMARKLQEKRDRLRARIGQIDTL